MVDDSAPEVSNRSLWRLAWRALLGFWALHLIYRVCLAVLNDRTAELFDPALHAALAFGFCLTVAYCGVLKLFLRRGLTFGLGLAALLSFPLSLLFASVEWTIFYNISPELTRASTTRTMPDGTVVTSTSNGEVTYRRPGAPPTTVRLAPPRERAWAQAPRTVAGNTTGWYFFYFGLGALFVGLANAERLRRAERRAAEYQRLAHVSQLKALRYQVNPHFLFNTLNSLSALILTNEAEQAEEMLLKLSAFFRTTLTLDPTDDIELREEIALQQLYLDVESTRFTDRLHVEIDIPEALLHARVPALVLQPLIENAIKYGVARFDEPVTIRIGAVAEGTTLVLTVENNLAPAGDDRDGDHGTGVGLLNVRERLKARFGGHASCQAISKDQAFLVILRMPGALA